MTNVSHGFLLAIVLLVHVAIIIGDFKVLPAVWNVDSGPVAYANYARDPGRYQADVRMSAWGQAAGVSLQNRVALFLQERFGVRPIVPTFAFIFCQHILLGFAVFSYARVVSSRFDVAWLSVCFTFLAKPYAWNPGIFGDQMHASYAAHLALPFAVYGFSRCLENRPRSATVFLLLAGLCHPLLGLYATAAVMPHWLWLYRKTPRSLALAGRLAAMFGVCCAATLPGMFALGQGERLPSEELFTILQQNAHAFPWRRVNQIPVLLRNLILCPIIIWLALAVRGKGFDRRAKPFLVSVTLVCFGLAALHPVAAWFRNPQLVRLIMTRAPLLAAIAAVPLAMLYFLEVLYHRPSPGHRLVVLFFCLAPFVPAGCAVLFVMLAGGAAVSAQGMNGRPRHRTLYGIGLGVLALGLFVPPFVLPFLESGRAREHLYLLTGYDVKMKLYCAFGYAVLVAWVFRFVVRAGEHDEDRGTEARHGWLSGLRRLCRNPRCVTVIMLVSGMIALEYRSAYFRSQRRMTPEAKAYAETQEWVRDASPRTAAFIVNRAHGLSGWRTVADRPVISTAPVSGFYAVSRQTKEYDERLGQFFRAQRQQGHRLRTAAWTTPEVLAFAREFGGDYYVRRADAPVLDLPAEYENEFYTVYRVPSGHRTSRTVSEE